MTGESLARLPGHLLILGAAYAGKSEIAIQALEAEKATVVIGSAVLQEEILQERVRQLRALRPKHWEHVDAEVQLAEQLKRIASGGQQILLDSFNLWLANALLNDMQKYTGLQLIQHFDYEVRRIVDAMKSAKNRIVIVSSEAGAGISPPQEPARLFRQILGHAHVALARACPNVAWVTAGLVRMEKPL